MKYGPEKKMGSKPEKNQVTEPDFKDWKQTIVSKNQNLGCRLKGWLSVVIFKSLTKYESIIDLDYVLYKQTKFVKWPQPATFCSPLGAKLWQIIRVSVLDPLYIC